MINSKKLQTVGERDPLLPISLRFRVFNFPKQLTLTGNIIIFVEGKLLGQIEVAKTQEDGKVLPPHRNACSLARKSSGTWLFWSKMSKIQNDEYTWSGSVRWSLFHVKSTAVSQIEIL